MASLVCIERELMYLGLRTNLGTTERAVRRSAVVISDIRIHRHLEP